MRKVILSLILGILLLGVVFAASGAIWTTRNDCGTQSQDVNSYPVGQSVYINGANFNEGIYNWSITGQPGSLDPNIVVANGSVTVGDSGAFCFNAYTINPDDGGVYKADFGGKHDNYIVVGETPEVPEFGFAIGTATLLGSVALFFFVRKK